MARKTLCSLVVVSLTGTSAWAGRDQKIPVTQTVTSATTTTTAYKYDGPTIQDIAQQAKANTDKGKSKANAAIGITAAGVAASCWTGSSVCKYFVGGLVASIAVRMLMNGSSDQSIATYDAVTTDQDKYNPNNPTPTPTGSTPDYTQTPEWKAGQDVIAKLKKDGWKIDPTTGKITDPKGKTFSASIAGSAAAMRASGASDSDIQAFQSAMAKVPGLAAEKLKSADGSSESMFDESAGGGSPATAAAADGGQTPYGGLAAGAGQKIGIVRDPAQVAGMKKDFNGDPIGISQDSLFRMIDRRYQLHKQNGSFLSP